MKSIKNISLAILIALFFITNNVSAEKTAYYYSKEIKFSPQIPSPEQFLGYEIGTRITEHARVNEYFEKLASLSDRTKIIEIGKTNEGRKIKILIVSSPENLKKLDQIQSERAKVRAGEKLSSSPLIVFLGYNVHGNEASGAEAALLSAYYLVAAENENLKNELKDGVYLIDPLRNPDGHERFASWVNSNLSLNIINDSQVDREHTEAWPGGRGNHYWFDLNRDWVNLVNPESKARVNFYQSWLPHVQVDHHEMGTNSTFFFEPTNPNGNESPYVPQLTYQINKLFGDYYAKALNNIGSFYYTKESYDNKNPNFGSTYPDYNGGVGILFEQGSSRGIIQQSENGPLTFAHTILNQLTASLATVDAAIGNKDQLFKLQEQYYTVYKTDKEAVKSYIIGDSYDNTRLENFINLLLRHRLDVYQNNAEVTLNGVKYEKGKSYIIPVGQPNSALVKIIFDSKKDYKDALALGYGAGFSVAYSSGLSYTETLQSTKGAKVESLPIKTVNPLQKSDYAYLIDYRDSKVSKSLLKLLSKDVLVKTTFKPFTNVVENGSKDFSYGSLLIPVQGQKISSDELFETLKEVSTSDNVEIIPVSTGYSLKGIDLGSSSFKKLEKPEVLVLSGTGTSSSEVGEVWHLFDQKLQYPLVRAELTNVRRIDYNEFNRIILVGGDYGKPLAEKLKVWVDNGGTLITFNSASKWAIDNGIVTEKLVSEKSDSTKIIQRIPYALAEENEATKRIPTSIFETSIDITHPLGFGFTSAKLPVIRESSIFFKPSKSPYSTVAVYTENPLLNGYISDDNLKKLKSSASLLVSNSENGRVVLFAEDPTFRGIWDATSRVLVNAIIFGDNITNVGRNRD
ncbi:MAG: M14 family zinc carboxypeptidase [Paludibacter sp.]